MEPHGDLRPLSRSEDLSYDRQRISEQLRTIFGADALVDFASGSATRCHHVRHSSTRFDLDQLTCAGDVTVHLEDVGADMMMWIHAGRLTYRSPDGHGEAIRGDVRLLMAGTRPVSLQLVDTKVTLVHLISSASGGHPPTASGWLAPRTGGAAEVVKRTVAYSVDVVNAGDRVTAEGLIDPLSNLLFANAIAAFHARLAVDEPPSPAQQRLPAALRAALDYMEANAMRPISVADLAAQAYVTPRTVQYLFRRYLDTTPTAYLRRIRLANVRRELLLGLRSDTTVATIASRWGFGHTGRFAVLYREVYGESPHETLSR